MFSRSYLLLIAALACGLFLQETAPLLAQQSPPSSASTASSSASTSNCTASLLADTQAIAAGKPFKVAVRFQLAKGWHLYWRFPGDSGAPPSIQWLLPEGFEVGPIQWPMPHPLHSEGNITTYVYEDELVLTAMVKPPSVLSGSTVALKAKLKWFICSDTCMPGKGEVSLEIPVGTPTSFQQELFEKAAASLPLLPPPPFQVSWSRTPKTLEISVLNLPENQTLEIYPLPPKGMTPGKINLGTRTAGTQTASIDLSEPDPEGASWAALFVLSDKEGARKGWELSDLDSPKTTSAAGQSPAIPIATTQSAATNQPPVKSSNLFAVLWGAFLGGLLLNLMPCVLPVIALKIFGFTQQAGQDPRRVFRLGLAFTAGVFAFFLALAAAVIVLKAAGSSLNWGFQFQNPWILVGLIAAVFVFGMSLLGVFEITLANEANARLSELSGRHGYGGAFMHGMFTTLLGTSCTAPYLGVTLGFAVSQTGPTVLLIFLTIAVGMSLPYLLLTANPSLLRFLPKPGLWMERLKQGMGFVMLAVAVWLLSVLGQSRGVEALSGTAALLLVLGAGCWLVGILQSRFLSLLIAAALAATAYRVFLHDTLVQPAANASSATKALGGEIWKPYTAEALASARAAGHPVFVDFTADWCLNCKVNERLTLSKIEVLEAFKKRNVVLLKADWTNGEKEITAELNRFGRVGVPFYLLYPANGGEPVLFPELLTPTMVLEALQKLPQP